MIKHNLIISYRSFRRNKTSFLINIIGLSTGLACALLVYLWVSDEVKVDQFHEKDAQLYQVMTNFHNVQGIQTWDVTPIRLAETFAEQYPEVELATLTNNRYWPTGTIEAEEKRMEARRLFADEQFFDVFSYELLQGQSEHVLADKNNIVLSDELAEMLFQTTTNVIGKTVVWKNAFFEGAFTISGIFAAPSKHSSEQFDAVLHYDWVVEGDPYSINWNTNAAETYLVLKEGTNIDQFNEQIEYFMWSKVPERKTNRLFVQQYGSKYLYNRYENGKVAGGRIEYVKLFSIIGLFVLIIACINFMNLSTAQASQKMKEVGVKKAIGADRSTLVRQFLSESLLMSILGLIVAFGIVILLLPAFNAITGKSITLGFEAELLWSTAAIILFTGIVAGSYPAFYLSGFNVIAVLKGKRNSALSEQWVRRGLVVFQFAMAVMFIIGVLVVNKQMDYIQSKNLGFERDQVISFYRLRHDVDPEPFLNAVSDLPGVEYASVMVGSIFSGHSDQSGISWSGDESERDWVFKAPQVGYEVIETLSMQILEGRSFSKSRQDDHTKVVINESARKMMALENPIGKQLSFNGGYEVREIIGVVSDFHYGSLHQNIEPLIFRMPNWGWGTNTLVKLKAGTEQATIAQIAELYKEFHPSDESSTFDYTFLDDDYQILYAAEQRVALLSRYFSLLAIIVSCLGLFGLAAFTAERRTKEIGIRKILGASVWGIVQLLSTDYTKMVLGGIMLALPVSYFVYARWLENFAYSIDLTWIYFAAAALITLVFAWVVVGIQTVRAANLNPAVCLHYE